MPTGLSGIPDVYTSGFTGGAAISRYAALPGVKQRLDSGAAMSITEGCERLFCGAMRRVFLGEGTAQLVKPAMMGAQRSIVCLEVLDYVGGSSFRGFVTADTLVVFFERGSIGADLKSGLMALIELADSEHLRCSQLVVSVQRDLHSTEMERLTKDLGWVGFEPVTLSQWAGSDSLVSDKWLFLSMEV